MLLYKLPTQTQKKSREKLIDIGLGNGISTWFQNTGSRNKGSKLDFIKLKSFHIENKIIEWRNNLACGSIFVDHIAEGII